MNIPMVNLKAQYDSIKEEIDLAIQGILDSSSYILGEPVSRFESNFSSYITTNYCLGVSDGTVALELALRALGVVNGDEVITVPNTFIATTEAISAAGASIKFVDVSDDYTIDVDCLRRSLTEKTKAIIPVHLYGHPCDMDPIMEFAKENNLFVIEDCAQAHGALYKGKKVGSLGDVGCFSFMPAKILGAYGDAGAITTNSKEIFDRLLLLRNHGRQDKYSHAIESGNHRMDALQAAILDVKLKHIEKWILARRTIVNKYNERLNENFIKPKISSEVDHSNYVYVVRHPRRDELQAYLDSKGVKSQIYYPKPLHLQPAYGYLNLEKGLFPNTEKFSSEILSPPLFPELTEEQLDYIITSMNSFQ